MLGFGSRFAGIYQAHPDVGTLTVCDAAPDIDAVHLNSYIPDHARHTIAVLDAGKHCACTVPMATSLNDIQAIIADCSPAYRRTVFRNR